MLIQELEKICKECYKCGLSQTRTNVVFGEGSPESKVMLIGEGPGQQEDVTGRPFVGRAGQLLTKILASQNISRETDIYIANIVKCRPPGNRVPTTEEMQACIGYLHNQIQIIKPRIILLAGATAVQGFMGEKKPISKIRGQWFDGPNDSKVMPILHPSYLLRNESKAKGSPKWLMWQDIKEIRRAIDELGLIKR